MPEPVPPTGHLIQRADEYFLRHLGIGFEALAAPLDPANPAGLPARATSVYRAIIEARQGDDATPPRGVWQRQPMRADWPHVGNLAAGALRNQGKDLQLAAWLCEAQAHEHGITALAPCILLLQTLCERYWNDLHPQPERSAPASAPESEARINIIRWLDQKLAPTLRGAPLIRDEDGRTWPWADWEHARQADADATTRAAFDAALAATDDATLSEQQTCLAAALQAIELTQHTISDRIGAAAPRMTLLASQISDILHALRTELADRNPAPAPEQEPVTPAP